MTAEIVPTNPSKAALLTPLFGVQQTDSIKLDIFHQ